MRSILKYKRTLGILIAAVLLYLSFHDLDREEIAQIISETDYWLLLPAAFFAFLVNVFKALRWRIIVDPVKPMPIRKMYSIFSVGQMVNCSLPALTGQAARVLVLANGAKLPKTYCATTVVLEVLFDGLSLILLIAAASTIFVVPGWVSRSGLLGGGVIVALMVVFLLIVHNRRRIRIYGRRKFKRRHPKIFNKIRHVARSFADALDMLKSIRHTLLTALYSLCLWVSHALVIVFLIEAFQLDMRPAGAMVILAINSVLLVFPITPGNLGTFQWACVASMALFGIDKESAVSFSIILHIMDLVPVFLMGLVFLYWDHMRYKDIRDEALKEAEHADDAGKAAKAGTKTGKKGDVDVEQEVIVEGD